MRHFLCLVYALLAAMGWAADFTTPSWNTKLVVGEDQVVVITETIHVHFNRASHGIFRKIPIRTVSDQGKSREVQYDLVSVLQAGQQATTKDYADGGDWVVRIGSPDVLVNGDVTYVVTYRVYGAITGFSDHDELFWNVIPTAWATEIERASLEIETPTPTPGVFKARILAGEKGSRWGVEVALGKAPVGDDKLVRATIEPGRVKAEVTRSIPRGSGVTAIVAMPSGTLGAAAAPPAAEPASNEDMGGGESTPPFSFKPEPGKWLLGGILPLLPLLPLMLLRMTTRRPTGPVVVQFEAPEGVSAATSGLLIDGKVDRQDMVAGILEVAQLGGFRIVHQENDTAVKVIENAPQSSMNEFQRRLYAAFLPFAPKVTADSLRGVFGARYASLKSTLESEAKRSGWIRSYTGCLTGCGFAFVSLALAAAGVFLSPCFAPLGLVIAIGVGSALSVGVGRWTSEGLAVRQKLLGLKEFIVRANERELDYMSRVDPTQALFETLLPYAVAFGAVRQWSDAFKGIELQPPTWTSGFSPSDAMWTAVLVNDLAGMNDSWGQAMSSAPPSSYGSGSGFSSGDSGFGGGFDSGGGGFSGGGDVGGGGGGGGGDSW